MKTFLRANLILLGASAVMIAASILLLGAEATARFGEDLFAHVSGWSGPNSPSWAPSMDSELRFYAALWLAYGVFALRTGIQFDRREDETPILLGVFFAGGLGRLLSWAAVGPPHPFFLMLAAIELGLPPLLFLAWAALRRTRRPAAA